MRFSLFTLSSLIMFAAVGLRAGEQQAEPAPRVSSGADVAEEVFRNPASVLVKDASKAAVCPVCGEPLWKHAEEGFECVPKNLPKGMKLQRIVFRDAVCPVCSLAFKGPAPAEGSRNVETDTDFARHPVGKDTVVGRVWMCPRCGYATWYDRFNKAVPAEVAAHVKKNLAAETVKALKAQMDIPAPMLSDLSFLEQVDIPDLVKYRNAVALRQVCKMPDVEQARLALEASHAARRALCERISAIFISDAIRRVDEAMADDAGEKTTVAERIGRLELALKSGKIGEKTNDAAVKFCLNVNLAGLYDRQGESAQARACLEAAGALVPDVQVQAEHQRKVLSDLVARRKALLDEEASMRRLALPLYLKLIDTGQVQGADALAAGYLVGELFRRDGNVSAAKAWFTELTPAAARIDPFLKAALVSLCRMDAMKVAPDAVQAASARKVAQALGVDAADAVAEGSAEAAAPALPAPKSCRELMQNFFTAVTAWREEHAGEWPKTRDEVVAAGLITGEAVNDWVCPESKADLIYRRPPSGERTFILFHKDPTKCSCRLLLFTDGTVEELPRQK